jgi:hypothetical protein
MKRTLLISAVALALLGVLSVWAQSPPAMPQAPDVNTSQIAAGAALDAYKTWVERRLGDLWIAVFTPTTFTIPACDMSGAWGPFGSPAAGFIQPSSDPTYQCKAGWTATGQHLLYTKNVSVAGVYNFSASVASVSVGGAFHLEIAGKKISSPVVVPNTGAWSTYQVLTPGTVTLPSGIVTIAVVVDAPGFDLLWLGFSKQ